MLWHVKRCTFYLKMTIMRKLFDFMFFFVLFLTVGSVHAQDIRTQVVDNGGSGSYKALMTTDKSLPTHTVFKPQDLSKFGKDHPMPILVWGNGACANSPHEHLNFLTEIASHGFFVVAIGIMPGEGEQVYEITGSKSLLDAIDWAIAQNADPNSMYYQKLDIDKIAAAGMSCGGLQTLDICQDPRLKTVMICNSGLFQNPVEAKSGMPMPSKEKLQAIHTPVIYIIGGETDIAYHNGMDDYSRIGHVPAFVANLNVGHGGTYAQPNGGEFGVVATNWLLWQLQGDKTAEKMFAGDPCLLAQREGWVVDKKLIP